MENADSVKDGCWVCEKKKKSTTTLYCRYLLSSLSQKYLSSSPFHHLAGLLSELQYIINYWLTFTTAGKGNFLESTDGTYKTLAVHLPSALMEKSDDEGGGLWDLRDLTLRFPSLKVLITTICLT